MIVGKDIPATDHRRLRLIVVHYIGPATEETHGDCWLFGRVKNR